jgi:hypothetical protein
MAEEPKAKEVQWVRTAGSVDLSEVPVSVVTEFTPVTTSWRHWEASAQPERKKLPRVVFVAYPYEKSKADYRAAFSEVGKEFDVTFVYADERITNKQILDKIKGMIEEAAFSIFDITTWNPNVSLELGIAVGLEEDYYILFDPTADQSDVPSELGGIDRLQYQDYATLKDELTRLLEQQYGAPSDEESAEGSQGEDFNAHIERLRGEVPSIVEADPGIQMGGIASKLGIQVEFAQSISRPLVEAGELETRGARRGMRYFIKGAAPDEGSAEEEQLPEAHSDEGNG